jgi:hypothetical protein
VVLLARVLEGFLPITFVLPLLAALCGHYCPLDGPDHYLTHFQRFLGSLLAAPVGSMSLFGFSFNYYLVTHFPS